MERAVARRGATVVNRPTVSWSDTFRDVFDGSKDRTLEFRALVKMIDDPEFNKSSYAGKRIMLPEGHMHFEYVEGYKSLPKVNLIDE
jgi:hypothetical protein